MKTNPSHFYNGKDDYLLAKACEVTGVTRVTTSRHRNGNLLSREEKMAASRESPADKHHIGYRGYPGYSTCLHVQASEEMDVVYIV